VLEPEEEGGFTVRVPSFAEIVTYDANEHEALEMAKDAIRLVLEGSAARGEAMRLSVTPTRCRWRCSRTWRARISSTTKIVSKATTRLSLRVSRVQGCPLSKQPSARRTCCTEVTRKGGGRLYELIVLLDFIIPV
jgi:antitoxin HicB